MLNKVFLIGNLGKDPEVDENVTKTTKVKLRVATDSRRKKEDGTYESITDWHDVQAWGKLGEDCKKHLSKGKRIHVEGKIVNRSYETDSGEKRTYTCVLAEKINFLTPSS